MKNLLFYQLLTVFVLLSTAFQAYAQDQILYVKASETDSPTCGTLASPCRTIAYALQNRVQATGVVAIRIVNDPSSVGNYMIPTPITRSNLIISGLNVDQPLNAFDSRNNTANESRVIFNNNSITIANGVNNVTIEGFEFRATNPSSTTPMITFQANGVNSNIILRRNSIVGSSGFTLGNSANQTQPFLFKDNTGRLTDIQIIENRFFGYNASNKTVIAINNAESGTIQGNVFGSANQYTNNSSPTSNYLDKAIVIGNVKNFEIVQNEFQGINFSAIELLSTLQVGAADDDAIVRIDSNRFDRVNVEAGGGSTGIAEPTIAAGILLRANNFTGDSVLIRYNEFLGNNRISIAVPNANNAFATNSIKIFSNRFSEANSQADLYIGSDSDSPTGKLDANTNWWGKATDPFTPSIIGTAGLNTDILGGASAISNARPVIWLTSGNDLDAGVAFVPTNQVVRSNGIDAELPLVFEAVPENWRLELADAGYTGTTPVVKRSFVLDPLEANEVLPNLTIDGENYDETEAVMILAKPIQVSGDLTFTKGKIALADNNLILAGNIAGSPGTNSFVLTEGTGQLRQSINATTKTFPVGYDADSYTPATITVPSGNFTFAIRAEPIEDDPVSPIVGNNGQTTLNAVGVIWQINKQTAGDANATLTLQWNETDELSGFNDAASYISKYDSTQSLWVNQEWPATPATSVSAGIWQRTVTGINSFSPFIIAGNNAPLPVDLISFDAELQHRGVLLTWNTASEKNNAYFAVERSTDSRTFAEIGRVTGRGTVEHINSYNFTDAAAVQIGISVAYYRLKQVDTDGKFNYSKVESVTLNNTVVKLFPNPASQKVMVTAPGNTQVQVINGQGQTVLQKAFTSSAELDISSLTKGMYIFRFLQKDKITSQKVSIF